MPIHASQMFARNVQTLIQHLTRRRRLSLDLGDEITGAMCVLFEGVEPSRPARPNPTGSTA